MTWVMAVVGHRGQRSHVFVVIVVMALAAGRRVQEGKLLLWAVETEHSGVQIHTALQKIDTAVYSTYYYAGLTMSVLLPLICRSVWGEFLNQLPLVVI